jgi:hypothetical protein
MGLDTEHNFLVSRLTPVPECSIWRRTKGSLRVDSESGRAAFFRVSCDEDLLEPYWERGVCGIRSSCSSVQHCAAHGESSGGEDANLVHTVLRREIERVIGERTWSTLYASPPPQGLHQSLSW